MDATKYLTQERETVTTDTEKYLMTPVEPKTRGGGRPAIVHPEDEVRKKQLLENPNQWFLWDGKAPRFQVVNLILRRLVGVKSTAPLDRKNWEFKGTTRTNGDGTYSIFIGYFPNGSPE